MTNLTQAINGNPLASSSSQVSGTRALSVIVEPEPVQVSTGESGVAALPTVGNDADCAVMSAASVEESVAAAVDESTELPESSVQGEAGITEDIRAAVQETVSSAETAYEDTLDMFEQASHALKEAFDEAGSRVTKLSFKLFEFAQASAQNNLDLARDCISVRSLPDILEVQTAYIKRQFDLLTDQVGVLHAR